jgi:protocatechuate 3,4-dioxygenase beta subunit
MTHDHDRGLQHDLRTLASRRKALRWLALGGLVPIVGCDIVASSGAGGSGGGTSALDSCSEIPEETAGPYPGDGTNGANALTTSGIVRSDITSSFGSMSGVAAGIPLTVTLQIVDASECAPLGKHAVYLWHADRDGRYSLYTVASQNYLRGVQETGSDGKVTFTTIFPAAYDGRWPHIHFEVYESLSTATNGKNKLVTSQLALPEDVCDDVYATSGYESSVSNLAKTSLDDDMVFGDGYELQLAKVTGSVSAGYAASLVVAI